ncbi:Glutathione import ATP-binding protein GsiA, partial [Dysosmobacter welbionis]
MGGVLALAGLVTHGGLAPGGHRAGTADGCAALAAAVGVVIGVHDGAAHGGTPAHVTLAAGLADVDVLVLDVANLTDGGVAVGAHDADLAGRQTDLGVAALLGHQLSGGAGGAHQLGAVAGMQLDVMDHGTNGDVGDGQGVAGQNVRLGAGHDLVAGLQAQGRQDIALLAVLILDQSDVGAAVGIVLQAQHGGGADLVPLEVNDTVLALVAAAAVADGDAAVAVAAGALLQGLSQAGLGLRLLVDAVEPGDRHLPSGGSRRLKSFDRHVALHSFRLSDHTFEELDGLGIRRQLDIGLFPGLGHAGTAGTHALLLAGHRQGVDRGNLHTE